MKALVLKDYRRFAVEEVAVPVPEADEVLVRVRACGICGSDVHGMDGSSGRRIPPIIMGHEAAGGRCKGIGDGEFPQSSWAMKRRAKFFWWAAASPSGKPATA